MAVDTEQYAPMLIFSRTKYLGIGTIANMTLIGYSSDLVRFILGIIIGIIVGHKLPLPGNVLMALFLGPTVSFVGRYFFNRTKSSSNTD